MSSIGLNGVTLDGRYRVVGPLGEGAMGSVYRAEHLKLGRVVAVKVMNETLADPSARKRFEREAKAMAKLEHPHCASVIDVGVHEDMPFVVMELVSGQSLKDLVDRGPVPVARAVEIVRQVLSGLAHAHELGIVHRDIKPANIMLSQKAGLGDHVKILDFGLARMSGETSNLTAGVVLGTPSYMAPEQVRGVLLDGRADLYACGAMLFELLTGTKPFRSEVYDPVAICMMHLSEPIPRLVDHMPGHDFGALQAIVDRAMAKDREHRFPTANAFAAALVEAIGGERKAAGDAATAVLSSSSLVPMTGPMTAQLGPMSGPPPQVNAHGATSFLGPAASFTGGMPSPAPALPTTPPIAPSPTPPSPTAPRAAASARKPYALYAIGGGILAIVIVVAIVAGTGGDRSSSNAPPKPDDKVVAAPTPDAAGSQEDVIEMGSGGDEHAPEVLRKAADLAAAGRDMTAIDMLVKARRTYPKDARIPFLAGKLFARKMYFHDAFKHLRAAFELDPSHREDAEVAELVVRGFNAKYSYDATIASFLRNEMPTVAKPILERTAKSHGNAMVRKRAAAELRNYK